MTRPTIALAACVALLAASLGGCGQSAPASEVFPKAREITESNSRAFGDHVVHFNAQPTTMLTPEVARAFGIRRGDNRAMLNITVLHGPLPGTPVRADVVVTASNLLGQGKDIKMRELREGDAIYYIGEFRIANEEIVNFKVNVRPEGVGQSYELSFRQQFFRN